MKKRRRLIGTHTPLLLLLLSLPLLSLGLPGLHRVTSSSDTCGEPGTVGVLRDPVQPVRRGETKVPEETYILYSGYTVDAGILALACL